MTLEQAIAAIREKAAAYAPQQLELLEEFASFDSETKCVEGNARAVEICKRELAPLGVTTEEAFFEGVGSHLIARLKPEGESTGRIILNAHLDTVFPVGFAAANPWHIEGDWLYGLGVADCKAGFAVSAYAVRIMQELGLLPPKELTMLYTCDEEQGSQTASKVFEQEAPGAEMAYFFEPQEGDEDKLTLITSRDGVILGSMDIKGVEAHAGSAYLQGHSAIRELAAKILKYYSFNDYEREIYYNVAPISGGRPNGVVAGDAHMEFCIAGLPDNGPSFAEAEANLESLAADTEDPGCSAVIEYHTLFPALERTEKSAEAARMGIRAAELLGLQAEEIASPGAADAAWVFSFGCPGLDGLGPVCRDIHATSERLYIPSIRQKTEHFCMMLLMMNEQFKAA